MRVAAVVLALLLALAPWGLARAGTSAVIFEKVGAFDPNLRINPSVRSAAMGDAGTAAWWGVDPNHWANPALLGYAAGIRYEQNGTDYDSGARFTARRAVVGHGGVGFTTAGQPIRGLGRLQMDYPATVGPFELPSGYERIRSWGVGASVARLWTSAARLAGWSVPAFTRYVDVAAGYGEKRTEQVTGGTRDFGPVHNRDWGLLALVAVPIRVGNAASGRLEGAYGYSALGLRGLAGPTGTPRQHRNGWAIRAALDPPSGWTSPLPDWLAPGFGPLVSLAGAVDRVHEVSGSYRHSDNHWGAELGVANVAFVRVGDAARGTWGFGLALPVGRCGGFRYDHAVVRVDPEISDGTRALDGWTVWLDPLEIYRTTRPGAGKAGA